MIPMRVGFIGAGHIANVHAGILTKDARVRVAAVYDPDKTAADAFALKHEVLTARSVEELLSSVHAAYICSPNDTHAELSIQALRAGVHVFCEKPMATSLEDARRVLGISMGEDAIYQAGFNRRFAPVYAAIKDRIASGELRPISALFKMNRGELRKPAWTGDPARSGGFLYETPIHLLDMARYLLGEPVSVFCRARATVYNQLDDFTIFLRFASEATLTFSSNAHATWLFPFERVEVYGDHTMAATEEMERVTFAPGLEQPLQTLDFTQMPEESRWGYAEEDRRFIDAASGEARAAVSADDALRTVELVARCYEAVAAS